MGTTTYLYAHNMFEQAKDMMDNAISHNDQLSQIESQRAPDQPSHRWRNIVIGLAIAAVFVVFLASR